MVLRSRGTGSDAPATFFLGLNHLDITSPLLKFDFRVICVDFNKNHDWIVENRTSTNIFLGVNVNSTALLQALLTGLAPFLLSEWETVGKPALQSMINGVGSPDEKLALNALLQAVDVIAQAEIPKI